MDARTGCEDIRFRDRGDYLRHATSANETTRAHRERAYARAFAGDGGIPGFCVPCGDLSRFSIAASADGETPNWRESLHCARCGLFSRIRFSLDVLARSRPLRGMRIYLTEQTTPAYVWLKQAGADVHGSEFVTDPERRRVLDAYVASITDGADISLNVEDVTRLSFADASHDAVLSFDVLEHVPDYRAALREFRRVLAPDGVLVVTVPFDVARDDTLVRARLGTTGEIEHLVDPEYHGDPTTSDGCLAFYTFGWDLLDELRAAGFSDVHLAGGWAPAFGYLGTQLTLFATASEQRPTTSRVTTADYAARIAQEGRVFDDMADVHALPGIFHYWSNRHLLPMEQAFGFDHPYAFFAQQLARIADRATGAPRFISLGCGNCDAEVDIALRLRALGVREFTIDCLDLSYSMLERGRVLAAEHGVAEHILPVTGDFNQWDPRDAYDAVVANQSLHHVVALEQLFDTIRRVLPPHGAFIASDMIGRNGHLRWPEALAIVREIWDELPSRYRYNRQLSRQDDEFLDWDCSTEGFEGIRAQDILPLAVDRFGFELFLPFGNVIDPFIDRGFGHNFDPGSEWDRTFIDRVHARDEAEIHAGRIKPTHMMAVMSNDRRASPRLRSHLTPTFCVRRP